MTALKKSARSHWTQCPVLAVISTSALGIRSPSIAAPLGLLTLSSRPQMHQRGRRQVAEPAVAGEVHPPQRAQARRALQRRVGDDLGIDRRRVARSRSATRARRRRRTRDRCG